MAVVLVLTTVPDAARGETIARALVEAQLAACVNICAPMTSFYRWKGAIERDIEHQLVIKTTPDRVAAVEARIAELHPYELPELLIVPVAHGSAAYVDWVMNSTRVI
jgi:periplasmic divalent cation tolerance protein